MLALAAIPAAASDACWSASSTWTTRAERIRVCGSSPRSKFSRSLRSESTIRSPVSRFTRTTEPRVAAGCSRRSPTSTPRDASVSRTRRPSGSAPMMPTYAACRPKDAQAHSSVAVSPPHISDCSTMGIFPDAPSAWMAAGRTTTRSTEFAPTPTTSTRGMIFTTETTEEIQRGQGGLSKRKFLFVFSPCPLWLSFAIRAVIRAQWR